MNKIVHHLNTDIQPPHQFTFPFCYEPHPLCRLAAAEVEHHIVESGVWQGETSCGKMFGVLVVRYELGVRNYELGVRSCELGFIAAYSGLLAGRNDWAYFVPPVFDAQQPDGHFKVTERSISDINREIDCIRHSDEYKRVKAEEATLRQKAADRIAAMKQRIASAKAERDRRRSDAQAGLVHISEAETAAMTRESQTLKADLRFEDVKDFGDADMLLLPGGMPGSTHLNEHEGVRQALIAHHKAGKRIGAICAAPMVLASTGILNGKKATCYPGFEQYFAADTEYTGHLYEEDGNVITGEGPAATLPYAYKILSYFVGNEAVAELQKGMRYTHLMSSK